MKKEGIVTGVVLILFGAAVAVVGFILIQMHTPAKEKVQLCNDGWSYETKDGRIVETYVPELDTCKKEK